MLSRRLLLQSRQSRNSSVCLLCAARGHLLQVQQRPFGSSGPLQARKKKKAPKKPSDEQEGEQNERAPGTEGSKAAPSQSRQARKERGSSVGLSKRAQELKEFASATRKARRKTKEHVSDAEVSSRDILSGITLPPTPSAAGRKIRSTRKGDKPKTLKEALLGSKQNPDKSSSKARDGDQLDIEVLSPKDLDFQPVDVEVPPIPMLSYGLDRVLFNPGVYRLQDPRSRVYNFDPYLEKIMSVNEFDFTTLSEYKTSSKDKELLNITKRLGTKFTGSTSSMSGVLQHFHFLLSHFRQLNHDMLSRKFPDPNVKFSKITFGPSAMFLRWKDGLYAIDADKSYDTPNIMSWLGHSLEKLLTTERDEFERYRRSSIEKAPKEDNSARCFHYSKLGNFLMRSQLDAHDPRLPGTGVFDLKTRAVVSIRMDHKEYEVGSGYQLRFDRGEWESFEREFYDMTRATMLKYSLQVRMGRMDGIFVAYHNIERIFGFQYLSLPDLDNVLHGQTDTCLGDQEFKLSIRLLDELLQKATQQFPEKTLRLHFHARNGRTPFMYVFAEPVTEQEADQIQNANQAAHKAFERDIVGVNRADPEMQKEWHEIQDRVDDEVDEDDIRVPVKGAEETDETGSDEESTLVEDEDSTENSENMPESDETVEAQPDRPLMGWTLAVRNRVNGQYVNRPDDLKASDSWTVEYHVKEIAPEARWSLYDKLKDRRRTLVGEERAADTERLNVYRSMIRKYSERGRKWRKEQDEIDEQIGQQVYQPLGPGSQAGQPLET